MLRSLIFIPTYNEAENVELLYRQIESLGLDADILFLDDNSPDGTGAIIDRLASQNPRVHTIHRTGKLGIGSAHQTGIRWAYMHGYQVLVTMDCDFTHSPALITEFLSYAHSHDIVVGSRYMREGSLSDWNLFRKTLTHTGHLLTKNLLGMTEDATGAFRLYRLDRIPAGTFSLVASQSYSFFFESLYLLRLNGCSIKEIAIDLPARTYGTSKMRVKDAISSLALLGHLWFKTIIDKDSMIWAEPVVPVRSELPASQMEQDWDIYWSAQKKAGNAVYDLIAVIYRKLIIKRILNYFIGKHFPPGARLLHAGCGSGQVDADLANRVEISALDISLPALAIYRKSNPQVQQLVHGSIFELQLQEESFDGIYNLGVMEHFTEAEIDRILRQFHRVLKPGGKIILFWPPSFGLTVRVLAAVHWFAHNVLNSSLKLHPDEITHVRSRKQVRAYLENTGFTLNDFYFGVKDMFTHAVVVGHKAEPAGMKAAISASEVVRTA